MRPATLLAALLLAGCASTHTPPAAPPAPTGTAGVLNPAVTQQTIATTVCVPGWSDSIRPPSAYTSALKRRQMAELHLTGRPADYEEDHVIPLALGGAARDERNLRPVLWPQARKDDRLETLLHRLVCARQMTLADGQYLIVAVKRSEG
jgi:hypothetical protein